MYPIPLAPRPGPAGRRQQPRIRASETRASSSSRMSARASCRCRPARPIRQLRIFQVLPKTTTHVANQPRLGYANAESARMMLGTVPVEADGSAYFRAPAGKPLYFQAVDETGHAVQTMRSITYLQPGERRSCLGCHEPPGAAPGNAALPSGSSGQRGSCDPGAGPAPAALEDRARPAGDTAPELSPAVQPVLDRHCVRCHDGSRGSLKAAPVLTGEPVNTFTRSYENLRPYVRWYEWGGKSIREIGTQPGHSGADESRLLKIVQDATHSSRSSCPGRTTCGCASGSTRTSPSTAPTRKRPKSPNRPGRSFRRRPCNEKSRMRLGTYDK